MQFRLHHLFAIVALAALTMAAATASTKTIALGWTALMFAIVAASRLRSLPATRRWADVVEELVSMVVAMFWGLIVGLCAGMPLFLLTGWPPEPWNAIGGGVCAMLASYAVFPSWLQISRPESDQNRAT